jgi:hypothetical protein
VREDSEIPSDHFRIGAMLHALDKIGATELLGDGPKGIVELARATGCRASSLARLLRALAAFEVVAEDALGHFRLPSDGGRLTHLPLRSVVATGATGLAHLHAAWLELAHAVRTGRSAFQYAHGIEYRTYLARHIERSADRSGRLDSEADEWARSLAAVHDVSSAATIVDVGGAPGVLLTALLEQNRGARGVVFDLPSLRSATRAFLEGRGLAGRAEVVTGDFLAEPPPRGDVHLLANVIGDRSDEDSARILQNCRRSAQLASRLLVVETHGASSGALADVERMVLYGDVRDRALDEVRALIEAAGFRVEPIARIESHTSIFEGTPV